MVDESEFMKKAFKDVRFLMFLCIILTIGLVVLTGYTVQREQTYCTDLGGSYILYNQSVVCVMPSNYPLCRDSENKLYLEKPSFEVNAMT